MIKIKDMTVGEYYIHLKSQAIVYVLSNTHSNASTTAKAQNVLVYSFNAGTGWSNDRTETHPSDQDMDMNHVQKSIISTSGLVKHPKDVVKKSTVSLGGQDLSKQMDRFFVAKKKKVAAPKFPKRPAIEENKKSVTCVKCKQPTKEIALFNSMTRYCPTCE